MRQAVRYRTFEVAERGSGHFVVSATGALDGDAARELTETLLPLAGAPGTQVVVDLTGAHAIDNTAVGVLVAAAHVARREGGELVVVTPDRRLLRTLDEIGLGGLARIEQALGSAAELWEEPS